jgi:hypothetical protein
MTTIDVHAHLYDQRYLSEMTQLLSSPQTATERASAALLARIQSDPRCCEVSERVELMQRIGLDHQVLSLSIPFSNNGDNATRATLATADAPGRTLGNGKPRTRCVSSSMPT